MAQVPRKSVRKLVTLPMDLAERVENFRKTSGATSESDALKALIEHGLRAKDTVEDLFQRCTTATASGQSLGEMINSLITDHPLVESAQIDSDNLYVNLKTSSDDTSKRFRFFRTKKEWRREYWDSSGYGDDRWTPLEVKKSAARRDDMDDEIPF